MIHAAHGRRLFVRGRVQLPCRSRSSLRGLGASFWCKRRPDSSFGRWSETLSVIAASGSLQKFAAEGAILQLEQGSLKRCDSSSSCALLILVFPSALSVREASPSLKECEMAVLASNCCDNSLLISWPHFPAWLATVMIVPVCEFISS